MDYITSIAYYVNNAHSSYKISIYAYAPLAEALKLSQDKIAQLTAALEQRSSEIHRLQVWPFYTIHISVSLLLNLG